MRYAFVLFFETGALKVVIVSSPYIPRIFSSSTIGERACSGRDKTDVPRLNGRTHTYLLAPLPHEGNGTRGSRRLRKGCLHELTVSCGSRGSEIKISRLELRITFRSKEMRAQLHGFIYTISGGHSFKFVLGQFAQINALSANRGMQRAVKEAASVIDLTHSLDALKE
jgi:hypothetical protein